MNRQGDCSTVAPAPAAPPTSGVPTAFRKDINGLRAIAVVAVVLFHFHPAWLPGGFAGVDVFFVISGYLITGIIMRGLKNGTFRLVTFYASRARRIVPALAVLCFCLLLLGWFYLLPLDYSALGSHVASSLGFVSNFVYWREAGYFTASAHEKWLLHTWSLSVEWQFYLLYPIVLLLLSRVVALHNLRWWVLGGCMTGFGLCIVASWQAPEAAFYLLPARAWELLSGGVACVFPFQLRALQQRALEALGLAMIVAGFFLLSVQDTWPGYLVALPVLGTFAVITAARNDSSLTGNPLSQWLGKLSYSLYLWHWPLVVWMSYAGWLGEMRTVLPGMLLALTLGLVSWRLIEQPVSKPARVGRWKFASLTALVFVAGALVSVNRGVITPMRAISVSDKALFIEEYVDRQHHLYEPYWLKCDAFSAMTQRGQTGIDEACTHQQGAGGVFLWGDSHAQALSLGLRTLLARNTPFYQVASASCLPDLLDHAGRASATSRACDYSNRTALQSIERLRPETVVIAQKDGHDKTDWRRIAIRLKGFGVRHVVLIGPLPQWNPSLPSVIVNRHWGLTEPYINDPALDRSIMATDQTARQLAASAGIRFVSLIDKLCIADACRVRPEDSNSLLQIDSGHLSAEGSLYVVRNYVLPQLMNP
ncbi:MULTISPECIES: acyltransferase family protein [Pseudomonas syringae group]|uniref:acyltransferase family protein n=1 Tax=Pseudomonas syringae group TaxID=136849 RepID=UPI0006E545F1|nr:MULTISPECIES: acyltransferase family protein [Pseudomonas syringae group]KPX30985.1 Acyltransferase family protein [Pseudomonas coronafaciens pv. garcae]KPY02938.1 Acyltransferase family protein [Pseudomonas coronafaciens pv. oryzae]MCF5805832.1 acyltransferase family protein [Pseudomonas tremae]MCF5808230.1 acyltransferase family protein [Pseudomonas tremae]RMN34841.1 O-antigen acetylase [Pseudomonas coronafaciens pv. zizaniae]